MCSTENIEKEKKKDSVKWPVNDIVTGCHCCFVVGQSLFFSLHSFFSPTTVVKNVIASLNPKYLHFHNSFLTIPIYGILLFLCLNYLKIHQETLELILSYLMLGSKQSTIQFSVYCYRCLRIEFILCCMSSLHILCLSSFLLFELIPQMIIHVIGFYGLTILYHLKPAILYRVTEANLEQRNQ